MKMDYERAIEELKHYESQYPMYFYDACVLDEETVTLAIAALSRSRIRDTATEPPTMGDGNEREFILVWCEDVSNDCNSRWSIRPFRYVTKETAKVFPKWTQLPEVE